ncbi:MAG TPA: acyltransferase family protein [Candidatus Kapabacteria bacterium]|nr:acyltransferase family protein [Candidatus Kapabacteria bacterium]
MSRLHYLDHLRAHMMLLGILFHCALSYSHFEPGEDWAYVEPASHHLFDLACGTIHLFRMPAFFIVAGFFAALILERKSARHFMRDRSLRVVLPLLLLALPNEWITRAIYASSRTLSPAAVPVATEMFEWHHLWFLYFLALFYGIHLLLQSLSGRLGWQLPARWQQTPVTLLALPFGLIMGLTVYGNGTLADAAPIALLPDPGQFLFYLACYSLGALLYGHPGLTGRQPALLGIGSATRHWLFWSLLSLASANIVLFASQIGSNGFNPVSALSLGMAKVYAALLVMALYQRYLRQENALVRYLSNSSYWLYLIHFPLAIALPPLLHDWPLAPTLKFGLVLVATLGLGLLSYEFLVRDTPVGALLNGRRIPRRRSTSLAPAPW